MVHLGSARADARLLTRALTLSGLLAVGLGAASAAQAEGQAAAPIRTLEALNPTVHTVSDAELRAAVQNADFSATALASRPAPPAASRPAPSPASPLFATLAATDIAKPLRALAAVNSRDLECLSQAVYFEARGEPMAGQAAVAQVVMNRVRHPAFPKSVCGVVFQRAGHSCQFSWACHGPGAPGATGQWAQARAIASRVLAGEVIAGVGFATHFNGARAGGFGAGLQRVALIGHHAFYRFNGSKGASSMFAAAPVQVASQTNQAKAAPALRPVYASFAVLPSPAAAGQLLAKASVAVQQATAAAQSAASSLVEQWRPDLAGKPAPALAAADAAASTAVDHASSNDRVGDSKPHPAG